MSTCKRLKVDKNKICFGDYRHVIELLSRDIKAPSIGEKQAEEVFVNIDTPYAAVKTFGGGNVGSRGIRRFNGINIDPKATHLFFVPFTDLYAAIETENNFILFSGKHYSILSVDDINEDNLTIMYQCTERGTATKEASKA